MALLTRALWSIVPAYLLGAAVYELVLALTGGTEGRRGVVLAALFAMLAGAGLAIMSVPLGGPVWALAALAPSAAAFTLARFYTDDSYYSTPRRYADTGAVGTAWIYIFAAAGVVAGVLAWRIPRTGAIATAAVLVLLVGMNAAISSH